MLENPQLQRLIDIGMTACRHGRVAEARTIFDGVLAQKPAFSPALIGQAFSRIVVNEFDDAVALLKDTVLDAHPEDAEARAMLGLAYFLADRKDESRTELEIVAETDGPAADMAKGLLAEL